MGRYWGRAEGETQDRTWVARAPRTDDFRTSIAKGWCEWCTEEGVVMDWVIKEVTLDDSPELRWRSGVAVVSICWCGVMIGEEGRGSRY